MQSRYVTRPGIQSNPLNVIAAAAAVLLLALIVPVAVADPGTGNGNREPELSGEFAKLNVADGHVVAFHAYAAGVQIYRWNGASWAFVAPEAVLFADEAGESVVGIHYGGPTWESHSGSKVVAAVIDRTPVPGTIDWLKLGAVSSTGPGIFDGVTFIQRVNTTGGAAPASAGSFVGQEARVPYTAEYYFYRAPGQP